MANANSITIPSVPDIEADTLKKIDEGLEQLQPAVDQYNSLNSLKQRLTGPLRVNGRPTGAGRPRARQGGRKAQFVELIQKEPGIKIPDAAEKLGIESNYLYRVRGQAVAAGEIRVDDNGGHFPVEAAK